MSEALTAKAVLEGQTQRFVPAKAAGVNVVVQYILTGEGGGNYFLTIADGKCTLTAGAAPSPKLTLTMALSDYADMLAGKLNGMEAFSSGKLKLGGDIMFATKLQSFFGASA